MSDSPSMPNLLDLFEIEDGEILDDVQRGDSTGPRESAIDEKTFGDTAKNTDLKSGQNGAGGAGKIVTNSNTRSPPCEEEQSSKRRKFNPSPVSMQVSAPQCHDYVLPLDEMGMARDIMTPRLASSSNLSVPMNNREESSAVANHTPQSSSTPLPMRVSAVSYQDNSSACHMRGPVPNWPNQGQGQAQWQLQTFSPPSANAGYYTYPQGQSFPPPGHNTAHSSSTYSQDHRFPQPGHNAAHSSTLPSSAHSSSLPSTAHSSSQPSKSLTVRSVGKGTGKSAYVTRPSTTSVVSKIVSEQPPKQMKMMPAKTVAELVEKKFIVVRSMAFVDSRR